MKWKKLGLVYRAQDHAIAPCALVRDRKSVRVYAGFFDAMGISRIHRIDLDAADPTRVLGVSERAVLGLGRAGRFDDNGVMPASVCRANGAVYLYYTGFQLRTDVRYTMFGGLAVSRDDGETFERVQEAPVLGPAEEGRYFRGGPCALFEDGVFKVWYSGGSQWETVGGKPRPTYDLYYQESSDGARFADSGRLCLSYDRKTQHGLGRPQIFKAGGSYYLFYTIRTRDMRYSMGVAVSRDGRAWTQRDDEIGLTHAAAGWDSEMVYFPSPFEAGGQVYMLYNGNDFGKEGFGLAKLESW